MCVCVCVCRPVRLDRITCSPVDALESMSYPQEVVFWIVKNRFTGQALVTGVPQPGRPEAQYFNPRRLFCLSQHLTPAGWMAIRCLYLLVRRFPEYQWAWRQDAVSGSFTGLQDCFRVVITASSWSCCFCVCVYDTHVRGRREKNR